MARFGFSGLKTVKTYFCHYEQWRSNGKHFPKSYRAQHAHEKPAVYKNTVKTAKNFIGWRTPPNSAPDPLSRTCDNLSPELSVQALWLLTGTHHPLCPHPHTWAASPTHQWGLLKCFLTIIQTLQVLLRQPFQVKLQKGKTTMWLDLTANSLVTQQALSLICHNHNFVTSQFAEKNAFQFCETITYKSRSQALFSHYSTFAVSYLYLLSLPNAFYCKKAEVSCEAGSQSTLRAAPTLCYNCFLSSKNTTYIKIVG